LKSFRTSNVDELVFDIRKSVAATLAISFSRVLLQYEGKDIAVGVDLDDPLTAAEVESLSSSGDLTLKILAPLNAAPITDTQLDFLVSEWENTMKMSAETLEEKEMMRKSQKYQYTDDIMRQSIEDSGMPISDAEQDEQVKTLRSSLKDHLDYISDKEGLTDEELQERLASIGTYKNQLSSGWKDHMTQVHHSVSGSMALNLEPSSETWPSSSTSVKLLRLSTSAKSNAEKELRFSDDGGDFPLMGSVDSLAPGKGRYTFRDSLESENSDFKSGGILDVKETGRNFSFTSSAEDGKVEHFNRLKAYLCKFFFLLFFTIRSHRN
jgi:hypothetical protein